jgi:hypothetical protein
LCSFYRCFLLLLSCAHFIVAITPLSALLILTLIPSALLCRLWFLISVLKSSLMFPHDCVSVALRYVTKLKDVPEADQVLKPKVCLLALTLHCFPAHFCDFCCFMFCDSCPIVRAVYFPVVFA